MDDVCAAVNSSLVQTLQCHLNNIEPSIQFTVERETNRKISFLDVTVCRQDNGRLSTKVYRKPTHTERYLSFHSHHPVAHKRAVVKSLTDRAKTIPSSSDQQSKEMKHVTAALVANGYPKRFVIDVGKPKRPAPQLSTIAPDAAKGFCILPYIKGTSEPIKRILSNHGIIVAQKPHQTIGDLFPKPKDPVPKDQTRGAIYSIPCKDCDKSYIGETKRKFSTRLKEHQKAVEHKHSQKSALAEHCLRSGHNLSWEASKILRTNANWRNRRILEAWEINTCRNPLNRDDGMHLPHEFLNLALRDRI